jgi:hypothetical protein
MMKNLKKKYKLNWNKPVSNQLKQIIIGLLLGDLHLFQNTKGSCYFKFEQGYLHKDYLIHLYNLFINYTNTEPKSRSRLNKKSGKINKS